VYHYVQVTNTLNGTSAAVVSSTAKIMVYDVGTAEAIRSVGVTVTAPVKDCIPAAAARAFRRVRLRGQRHLPLSATLARDRIA